MRTSLFIVCIVMLFACPLIDAMEIGGIQLPDTMTIGEANVMLNGAGLRKKAWIKVYAGGLYLKEQSKDAANICSADEPMAIRMHFIYDGVSKEKLIAAWNEGFGKATDGDIAAITKEITTFNSFYTSEAKKGDIHDLIYEPGKGVTVIIAGKEMGSISGLAFKNALFGIWLCDQPADKNLKAGMLGI